MSVPSVSLNENSPAGSDNIALGDNRIREYKTQVREVMEIDHDFPSSGSSLTAGQHKKVTLQEQADLGTGATGTPILGAQTINGVAELVFTTEANSDLQLTKGEYVHLDVGILSNNVPLKAKNNTGAGAVDLINANTSDQAVLPTATVANNGVILLESTAPTTIANQGAVYTKNDGAQTELYFREESNGDEVQITDGGAVKVPPGLGAWVDKSSSYAAQQAATDGFLVAYALVTGGSSSITIPLYTDSNSDPTTIRGSMQVDGDSAPDRGSLFCPVKKNDYWKIVPSTTSNLSLAVYWIPLGA